MFVKSSTLLSCKMCYHPLTPPFLHPNEGKSSYACDEVGVVCMKSKQRDEKRRINERKNKKKEAFNGKAINNEHKCRNIRYPSLKLYLFTMPDVTRENSAAA